MNRYILLITMFFLPILFAMGQEVALSLDYDRDSVHKLENFHEKIEIVQFYRNTITPMNVSVVSITQNDTPWTEKYQPQITLQIIKILLDATITKVDVGYMIKINSISMTLNNSEFDVDVLNQKTIHFANPSVCRLMEDVELNEELEKTISLISSYHIDLFSPTYTEEILKYRIYFPEEIEDIIFFKHDGPMGLLTTMFLEKNKDITVVASKQEKETKLGDKGIMRNLVVKEKAVNQFTIPSDSNKAILTSIMFFETTDMDIFDIDKNFFAHVQSVMIQIKKCISKEEIFPN